MTQNVTFQDRELTCRDCQAPFVFEAKEAEFFASMNFNPPARCKNCRAMRKAASQQNQSPQQQTRPAGGPVQATGHSHAPAAPPVEYVKGGGGGGGRRNGGGGGGGGGGKRRRDRNDYDRD